MYSLTRGRCLGLTFGSWNNFIGGALRDGPAALAAGFEVLLVMVVLVGFLGKRPVGFLGTSACVSVVAVAASLRSGKIRDSLGIVAEVGSEARRCARLPGTVDRLDTVDDFTSLEA